MLSFLAKGKEYSVSKNTNHIVNILQILLFYVK